MRNTFALLAFLTCVFLGSSAAYAKKIIPPKGPSECNGRDIRAAYQHNEGQAISCTRSKWDQARLYKRFGARQAAAPGHSRHERGCACDFRSRGLRGGTQGGRWLSNNRGHRGNHLSDTGH